jgi:hypothetical protein
VPTLDAGSGRWLVLIGWLWLGWHLFVRSSVPGLWRRVTCLSVVLDPSEGARPPRPQDRLVLESSLQPIGLSGLR